MTARDRSLRWDVLTLVVFVGITVTWVIIELIAGGGLAPPGKRPYKLEAAAPSAISLTPGARVTVAGIRVGSVTTVERDGPAARLSLRIDDTRITPLPVDSRLRIRARTAVGENYVSIVPGRSTSHLASGALLPAERTDEYVDVDRILSVLRGRTRQHARELLQSTGNGLHGRGAQLNAVAGDGSDLVSDIGRIVDTVHPQRGRLSRLIDQVGVVSTAVGERGQAIRTLAEQGTAALTAVRDRDDALADVLRQLPDTLERVRSASAVLNRTTQQAAPVVSDLAVAVRRLRPSVRTLQPAAGAARVALRELGASTPALERVISKLSSASGPLATALPELRKALCQANPALDYLKPYTADALDTFTGLGSLANAYDATGHTARLGLLFNDNTISGVPDQVNEATHLLLHSGLLTKLNGRSYEAYPKPGQAGIAAAVPGGPEGPTKVPGSGYVYPRVKAAC